MNSDPINQVNVDPLDEYKSVLIPLPRSMWIPWMIKNPDPATLMNVNPSDE